MSAYSHFDVCRQNDVNIVRFRCAHLHDYLLLNELHDELVEFVEREKPHHLLFDLGKVEFCSTSLINTLLIARKILMIRAGIVKLADPRPSVEENFRTLNLEGSIFDIYPTVDAALEAFHAEAESDRQV